MDGTLYIDETLIEGASEFLSLLRRTNRRPIYITNNSSRSVEDYVHKLKRMGIDTSSSEFFTSSMGMALYLNRNHPGQIVYCMGTRSLVEELRKAKISVTTVPTEDVEVVVLGYDTELTYQKLDDVCRLLQKDRPYLATNPDLVCPVKYGFAPDCGAMAEMIAHATGKNPKFIGKPDPLILLQALQMVRCDPQDAVVIGDRLYTDIQSGINAGITTVAVLSGESTLIDIRQSQVQPDFVISSVQVLADFLRE